MGLPWGYPQIVDSWLSGFEGDRGWLGGVGGGVVFEIHWRLHSKRGVYAASVVNYFDPLSNSSSCFMTCGILLSIIEFSLQR